MRYRYTLHDISRLTLEQAEMYRDHALISAHQFKRYLVLWIWSAPRFSDPAATKRHTFRLTAGENGIDRKEAWSRRYLANLRSA